MKFFQNRLYVGGFFTTAGGLNAPYLAIWGCPQLACYPNCDQSTATPSLTANDFMCFINKFAAAARSPKKEAPSIRRGLVFF